MRARRGLGSGMRVALLPLCLGLSACAAQGPYPSLAPRAIERGLAGGLAPAPCLDGDGAETQVVAVAPAPVPSDPQLRARLAALLAQARQGQSAFAEILPRASSSAARAGAAGSDAWIAAHVELLLSAICSIDQDVLTVWCTT